MIFSIKGVSLKFEFNDKYIIGIYIRREKNQDTL